MADHDPAAIERLLSGTDRPRALRPEFRALLESRLAAATRADPDQGARALDPSLAEWLSEALSRRPEDREAQSDQETDAIAILLSALDGPRELPVDMSERLRSGLLPGSPGYRVQPGGRRLRLKMRSGGARWVGAAAAVLLLLGTVGVGLHSAGSGGSPSASRTAGHSGVPTSLAAGAASGAASATGGTAGPFTNASAPSGVTGSAPTAQVPAPSGVPSAGSSLGVAAPHPVGPPAVRSVSPRSGPATGGTWVTISGTMFSGATTVRFGDSQSSFVVDSDQQIRAFSPAHVPGRVDIVVVTSRGTSAVVPGDSFQFTS